MIQAVTDLETDAYERSDSSILDTERRLNCVYFYFKIDSSHAAEYLVYGLQIPKM